MKTFLMVVLTLGLILITVEATVAEDRLVLKGSMRIRAYDLDNETNSDRTTNDRYLDGYDNSASYLDSRFRFGLEITLSEGVTANLRMDLHDDNVWGGSDINTDGGLGRPKEGGPTMEIDRMFVRVEKDLLIYQGGQIFQTFGVPQMTTAYGPQNMGMALRLKLPVMVDFNYFKVSEAAGELDAEQGEQEIFDDSDNEKDINQYGIQTQYQSEQFTVGAYYATITDTSDTEYDPNVIGLWSVAQFGPVKINANLDIFGGSKDDTQDYTGTQLWLNGEIPATDTLNTGFNCYYAMAADEDGSEEQLTSMPGKYGGFEPHELGLQELDDGLDPAGNNTPFDLESIGAGTLGFDIYANMNVIKNVTLAGQIGYAMPENKDAAVNPSLNNDKWENSIYIEASVNYEFAPKSDLLGVVYYRSVSYENEDTQAPLGLAALLEIDW